MKLKNKHRKQKILKGLVADAGMDTHMKCCDCGDPLHKVTMTRDEYYVFLSSLEPETFGEFGDFVNESELF
jgi:hypothetical protein